jgi:hypothetical protein
MVIPSALDEVELGWLFYWNIGKLRTAQNLVNNFSCAAGHIWEVWPVRHQTFSQGILRANSRHPPAHVFALQR